MESKLNVGQKVYLKPTKANKTCKEDYVEYEVKRIGEVFFEVWRGNDESTKLMFYVKTKKQISSSPMMWRLYLNPQEILDEAEFKEYLSLIKKKLNDPANLTLDQLKQIKQIIE